MSRNAYIRSKSENEIEGAVKAFLTYTRGRKYSRTTVKTRASDLRLFGAYLASVGVERLREVDSGLVREYCEGLRGEGLAASTIRGRLHSIRRFFDWLEAESLVFENLTAAVPLPKVPKEVPAVLEVGDVRKLLAAPDTSSVTGLRDRAILEVLYGLGLRRREMIELRVFDVDAREQSVRVRGKRGEVRVLPPGRRASQSVARYLKAARPKLAERNAGPDAEALWLTRFGEPFTINALRYVIKTHAKTAGLAVGPHTLRRSCAIGMLANGTEPLAVARLLGYSTMKGLADYLKITVRELKRLQAPRRNGGTR